MKNLIKNLTLLHLVIIFTILLFLSKATSAFYKMVILEGVKFMDLGCLEMLSFVIASLLLSVCVLGGIGWLFSFKGAGRVTLFDGGQGIEEPPKEDGDDLHNGPMFDGNNGL